MRFWILISLALAVVAAWSLARPARIEDKDLWDAYDRYLKTAKYVDLTHTITPRIPVWYGFGKSKFGPTLNPKTGKAYTYAKDGFEATHYDLATDQLGTQLDPPAHWNPSYA